jgi:acyl-CoA thioesterase
VVVEAASVNHPYADLIGLELGESEDGCSTCSLSVAERHLNPHGVVHGAVLYALADTGMGAALYPGLSPGEICATIEIKINYYRPVSSGEIRCHTEVVYRGRRVANLESSIYADDRLVAKANGSYSIFKLPEKGSGDR